MPMGGARGVFRRWKVHARHPSGAVAELDVEVDDGGHPRCRRITISDDGSAEVKSITLRRIPIAKLMADVMQSGAVLTKAPVPAGRGWRVDLLSATERADAYAAFSEGGRRPRRGVRLTDDQLRRVAEIYQTALRLGDPPTKTICEKEHVTRPTASRWVSMARARGVLGPAMPGRAG